MKSQEHKENFQDKELECVDCHSVFVFSAGEQRFYWSKGLREPKRCQSCRDRRKQTLPKELQDEG